MSDRQISSAVAFDNTQAFVLCEQLLVLFYKSATRSNTSSTVSHSNLILKDLLTQGSFLHHKALLCCQEENAGALVWAFLSLLLAVFKNLRSTAPAHCKNNGDADGEKDAAVGQYQLWSHQPSWLWLFLGYAQSHWFLPGQVTLTFSKCWNIIFTDSQLRFWWWC